MKKLFFLTLIVFTFNLLASKTYNGTIQFTEAEKQIHRDRINTFTTIGSQCLEDYKREHLNFFRNHCIRRNGKKLCLSKFYGERRFSKKRGAIRYEDKKPLTYLGDELRKWGFPVSWMNEMRQTSCVGMALDCLKKSFIGSGQESTWNKIRRYTVVENNSYGTALQFALQKLGWKVLYWNPAPYQTIQEDMKKWDAQEKNWRSKGYHWWRYHTLTTEGRYYKNPVDDMTTLVGFDQSTPNYIKNVPFWIGTANTGYHVFPGKDEKVVEAHSTRDIHSIDNLEFSDFSPFRVGGGPRWSETEKYRSGLIAVPPGY